MIAAAVTFVELMMFFFCGCIAGWIWGFFAGYKRGKKDDT